LKPQWQPKLLPQRQPKRLRLRLPQRQPKRLLRLKLHRLSNLLLSKKESLGSPFFIIYIYQQHYQQLNTLPHLIIH
jgi:hypothetical protein